LDSKAKAKKMKVSEYEVSPIFGKVQNIHCFDRPCYGTLSFLPNTVVVKCNICEKPNCIPCEASHPNQTCKEFQATKDLVIDHDAIFNDLKAQDKPEGKEESVKKTKKDEEASGNKEDSKDPNNNTMNQELTFIPDDAVQSTPVSEFKAIRKRLFSEDGKSLRSSKNLELSERSSLSRRIVRRTDRGSDTKRQFARSTNC
jgi:hypothetical protein